MSVTNVHWGRLGLVGFWLGALILFVAGSLLGGEVVHLYEREALQLEVAKEASLRNELAAAQTETEVEKLARIALEDQVREEMVALGQQQSRGDELERVAKELREQDLQLEESKEMIKEMYVRGSPITEDIALRLGLVDEAGQVTDPDAPPPEIPIQGRGGGA